MIFKYAQITKASYGLLGEEDSRVQLKSDGTPWQTRRDVKGKLANGVGSQYSSHYHGTCCIITTADAHTSAASSRLNWRPRRLKWNRPFRRNRKSGFCACAITFQTQSTIHFHRTQSKKKKLYFSESRTCSTLSCGFSVHHILTVWRLTHWGRGF